jgi:hypothetical protein
MAKVYDYNRFKILREIKDLENFVRRKYDEAKTMEFMWFDHYSVAHARSRVEQLKKELEALNDSPVSEE